MAIINTRSPHYVGLADVNIAYATLDIEVYSGNKNNGYSGTPQYSLRKQLIPGNAKIYF